MDKEEKVSSSEDKNGTGVPPVVPAANSSGNGGIPASQESKTKKRKAKSKKSISPAVWSTFAQIAVATIGVIGTITVAYFNYRSGQPIPTPALIPVSSTSPATPFITGTSISLITDTPLAVITPTITDTPTITATPSDTTIQTPAPPIMYVKLSADATTGKNPLIVKFDARDSYLLTPDGQRHPCRGGSCHYTWRVYSNGQQKGKSETGSGGTFQYTFGERGQYIVTVDICWGKEEAYCKGSGLQIEVTR